MVSSAHGGSFSFHGIENVLSHPFRFRGPLELPFAQKKILGYLGLREGALIVKATWRGHQINGNGLISAVVIFSCHPAKPPSGWKGVPGSLGTPGRSGIGNVSIELNVTIAGLLHVSILCWRHNSFAMSFWRQKQCASSTVQAAAWKESPASAHMHGFLPSRHIDLSGRAQMLFWEPFKHPLTWQLSDLGLYSKSDNLVVCKIKPSHLE